MIRANILSVKRDLGQVDRQMFKDFLSAFYDRNIDTVLTGNGLNNDDNQKNIGSFFNKRVIDAGNDLLQIGLFNRPNQNQ